MLTSLVRVHRRSTSRNLIGLGILISTLLAAHWAWECPAQDPVGCCAPTGATAPFDGVAPVTNSVSLEGIEIIQSVQDVGHSVPIVAMKPALVRVYLSADTVTGYGLLDGEITVTPLGGGSPVIVSNVRAVAVWDMWNGNWKTFKRQRLHASLNFELPGPVLAEGNYVVEVTKIADRVRNGAVVGCANCQGLLRRYSAVKTAPLRLRVVGVKYKMPDMTEHVPRQVDYDSIESWLRRAYPIAEVKFKTSVNAWNGSGPFVANGPNGANIFVSTVRAQEVGSGTDHRTHYYGLVFDGGFYFDGMSPRPPTADPASPGSGPAGKPLRMRHAWDEDDSYADHYTGHELGHSLGQRHVGGVCSEKGVDVNYPFPLGSLSFDDPEKAFMALDWGDPALNVQRQIMDGTYWHDAMSYCPYRWISSYTYCRIRDRLLAEDALPPPSPLRITPAGGSRLVEAEPAARLVEGAPLIVMIGAVDFRNGTGTISSLNRVERASVGAAGTRVRFIGYPANGSPVSAPATEYVDGEGGAIVTSVLPAEEFTRIDMVLDGRVVDKRQASPNPPQFQGEFERDYDPADGLRAISWKAADADGDSSLRYSALILDLDGETPAEMVLVESTDTGLSLADLKLPEGTKQIKVKVIVTDGFHAKEKIETVSLSPLNR